MKKVFQFVAIAVVTMALTVACKSKAEPVEEDTTPIETIVEDTIDTVIEEVVLDEPVKTVTKKDDNTMKADANSTAEQRIKKVVAREQAKQEVKTVDNNSSTQKVAESQGRINQANTKGDLPKRR